MAYNIVRPVLARVENPKQLQLIETRSPHIIGDTVELWQAIIKRDVAPVWRPKLNTPSDPSEWYEAYLEVMAKQRAAVALDEERLRGVMMGVKKEQETKVTHLVDIAQVKVPRDPKMRKNNGGASILKKKELPSNLNFTSGSKTKLTTGTSVLLRAKREARDISNMMRLSRPTHQLQGRSVAQAPKSMLQAGRIKQQPTVKIFTHRASSNRAPSTSTTSKDLLEDREARLRAITLGGAGTKRTFDGVAKESSRSTT